jgi:hypothetical protein
MQRRLQAQAGELTTSGVAANTTNQTNLIESENFEVSRPIELGSEMAPNAPPPYVRTVYDETLRSKFYGSPSIDSIANRPNLIGHLQHHSPDTDGSFSICIAGGEGVFISQACPYSPFIILKQLFTYFFRHYLTLFLLNIVQLSEKRTSQTSQP